MPINKKDAAPRTYPYKGWILSPTMRVKELEFVETDRFWGRTTWDKTQDRASYQLGQIHPTKAAAIEAGYARLLEHEARLKKHAETIAKRRATLAKAAG